MQYNELNCQCTGGGLEMACTKMLYSAFFCQLKIPLSLRIGQSLRKIPGCKSINDRDITNKTHASL